MLNAPTTARKMPVNNQTFTTKSPYKWWKLKGKDNRFQTVCLRFLPGKHRLRNSQCWIFQKVSKTFQQSLSFVWRYFHCTSRKIAGAQWSLAGNCVPARVRKKEISGNAWPTFPENVHARLTACVSPQWQSRSKRRSTPRTQRPLKPKSWDRVHRWQSQGVLP